MGSRKPLPPMIHVFVNWYVAYIVGNDDLKFSVPRAFFLARPLRVVTNLRRAAEFSRELWACYA
jgi:hypothetical protein